MKRSPSTARRDFATIFLPGLTLFMLLVLWELGVKVSKVEAWILPGPSQIVTSLWQVRELLWQHGVQTIYETFLGFSLAIIVGIALATVIDWSETLRKAIYPLLIISQTIPIIAVAPLLIIWFGYGLLPKILVVALVCFFPITINLADGYRLVDREMIRLMSAMGAGPGRIFTMVKLPAALPFFFSGLRIAGTYSVMGAVIGEWLGASKGLGIFMTRSSQSYLTDRVFAAIILITCLSLLIFLIIEGAARLIMPWYYRQRETSLFG
ncbi:binding-protein-dependent transport systems inner membrane component [Desulforamulus reducens MI-1]|uniref:Binding-protein-dependent transport systems inner membrane component n=1 Tax=Desulforamulus reducens (strain ATCC BAA-1160 / DSM 100696 / MI-1) TaxID=349161 RepID=A4J9F4_DESRM|nr:ABC transporter permease [Desulforamulus reducens]ABO51707.1 binding-protein-dependent transport systems inner membrane component [Desulforamulus reducens MI-1]